MSNLNKHSSRYGECVYVDAGPHGIEYEVWIRPDDTPVRGNALASGDDATDQECENDIIARLDQGDVWAWADVTVIARYKGFEGHDTLGGCCYQDTQDFVREGDGYYGDMKADALRDLARVLVAAKDAATELGDYLHV